MGRDLMVSRYAIPIGIPCVDGLSMGPSGFRTSHNQIGICFSLCVLGSPCSSKKEGRRKCLSFKKSRYGTLVWITCM